MISEQERLKSILQMLVTRYDPENNVTVQKVFDRHMLREFGLSVKNASMTGRKTTAQLLEEGVLSIAEENIAKASNILRIDFDQLYHFAQNHHINLKDEQTRERTPE